MMASKCKRMLKLGIAPAFDLTAVQEHTEAHGHDQHNNAAACEQMSDILACLSLGSWRDAADAEMLKSRGITHVLNVAKEVPPPSELAAMESGEFAHKSIPLQDCHSEDIGLHFEEAFGFIQEARQNNGKVLVHCRRGISRSPAIVVGYLMRHEGYSYHDAVEFVKARRNCVSLNLAFRTLLEEYTPTPLVCSLSHQDIPRHHHHHHHSTISPSSDIHEEQQQQHTNGASDQKKKKKSGVQGSSLSLPAPPPPSSSIADPPLTSLHPKDDMQNRCDSFGGSDFGGLSAPESERSSQPSKEAVSWE